MSNEQAPESCPFCGAAITVLNDGRQCRAEDDAWVAFTCLTSWHRGHPTPRNLQSRPCESAERERLTRERDGIKAAHTNALNQIGDLCMENAKLLARVKRLERLVDGVHYVDGVHLEEIDGLNWFDAMAKAKEATR